MHVFGIPSDMPSRTRYDGYFPQQPSANIQRTEFVGIIGKIDDYQQPVTPMFRADERNGFLMRSLNRSLKFASNSSWPDLRPDLHFVARGRSTGAASAHRPSAMASSQRRDSFMISMSSASKAGQFAWPRISPGWSLPRYGPSEALSFAPAA